MARWPRRRQAWCRPFPGRPSAADAGGALSLLHDNGKARCYLLSFAGEYAGKPTSREGDDRWTFPGSVPRLERRGPNERVTVQLQAFGPRPTPQDPQAVAAGPKVRFSGVKVHHPGRPLVDGLGKSALNNENAQRVLKSIGCDGRIASGLSRYVGKPRKHRSGSARD